MERKHRKKNKCNKHTSDHDPPVLRCAMQLKCFFFFCCSLSTLRSSVIRNVHDMLLPLSLSCPAPC